ncbi:Sterol-binding domain protein [Leucothrix sargassi]|nr:Sterol-binding domain protein [Leucothrix sargassi]
MKLPMSVLSIIERALNAYLKLDGEAFEREAQLAGKVVALHIKVLDIRLYFDISESDIQVLGEYGGEADATISGSLTSLVRLSQSEDSASMMLESDVEIKGDMRMAESFSRLLSDASIDWEEILSKWVGDPAAYQTGKAVRLSNGWIKESVHSMKENTSEYLSEETRVVAAEAEVDLYMKDVDELRFAVERLEARIKVLEAKHQTALDKDAND